MALKPDTEVTISLATAVMAYGTYQYALPAVADIRSIESNNVDIQGAERVAAWASAGLVGLVALITKSPNVFILGGSTVVAASWMARHADQVDTVTKRASVAMDPVKQIGSTPSGVTAGDEVSESKPLNVGVAYGSSVF